MTLNNTQKESIQDYLKLCRLDKPIGAYLLLWPTCWALWLSAEGIPSYKNLLIFGLGVFIMRSAGCIINDYADRDFDKKVKRTANRPLTNNKIKSKNAFILFFILLFISFLLVMATNLLTIKLSIIGVALTIIYPYTKRIISLPQFFIGLTFGWSIPMAFAAESGSVTPITWLLLVINIFWALIYDTQYAMVDRDDDIKIGIKSSATLFGKHDNTIIAILQIITLLLLTWLGILKEFKLFYFISIILCALLFIYQQKLTYKRKRNECFKAFLNHNWVGAIIFLGIFLNYI